MDSSKRNRSEVKSQERRSGGTKRSREHSNQVINKKKTSNAIIFDNGGYTIKVGRSSDDTPKILPNHIMKAKSERKRCFIGDQIEDCRDLSGLFYIMPHEHGYITKFDVQKTIWDYTFNKMNLDDSTLIMTQPILNFKHVQEYMDEIFFEEYDVKIMHRSTGTDLSRYHYVNEIKGVDTPCVVIDSGYSFTHIIPYINGKKFEDGIIRMDVGGKLLTNYLKDILSYRQLHVMEETYVINQVKEDTCFMSLDFKKEMNRAKNTNEIVKNYILPDFHNIRRGYMQDIQSTNELAETCQILRLNNERISVPEIIMKPSIIPGMEQAGLAQCIAKCIMKCPEKYRKALADNIVLTGGNCKFPGFKERVEAETRMYLPCEHKMTIYQPDNPVIYPWIGGKVLSTDPDLKSMCVTKQEYDEYGSNYTFKQFNQCYESDEEIEKKIETKPLFSYLQHWKSEGVDMFHKSAMTHIPNENDIQFKLEGDGIEEYDGKYVTLDFEYEEPKPIEKPKEIIVKEKILERTPTLKLIRKRNFFRPDLQSLSLPVASTSQIIQQPIIQIQKMSEPIYTANKTQELKITKIHEQTILNRSNPKVYKPVFRTKTDGKLMDSGKMTQILTLSTPLKLNNGSILVPSSGTKTVTLNSSLLNNTVILPQNLLTTSGVTLQIIPFRPEMLRQGGNFIITKKASN